MSSIFKPLQDTRFKTSFSFLNWTFPLWGTIIFSLFGIGVFLTGYTYIMQTNSIVFGLFYVSTVVIGLFIFIYSFLYALWFWGGIILIWSYFILEQFVITFIKSYYIVKDDLYSKYN